MPTPTYEVPKLSKLAERCLRPENPAPCQTPPTFDIKVVQKEVAEIYRHFSTIQSEMVKLEQKMNSVMSLISAEQKK